MSKLRRKSAKRTFDPRQPELPFHNHLLAGARAALNLSALNGEIQAAFQRAIGHLSRAFQKHDEIARKQMPDLLTWATGREVTQATVDAWLTPSKEKHRPPLLDFMIMALLLDCREALDEFLALAGERVATPRDQALAEIGQIQIEKEKLAARESSARRILGEK